MHLLEVSQSLRGVQASRGHLVNDMQMPTMYALILQYINVYIPIYIAYVYALHMHFGIIILILDANLLHIVTFSKLCINWANIYAEL